MERTGPTTLVAVLGFASPACKDKAPPAAAPADAGVPPFADAARAASATALDDLLHCTDARIGVSSKVDNPRDSRSTLPTSPRYGTAPASVALDTPEQECRTWLVPQKTAYDEFLDGGTMVNVPWEPPAPST